MSVGAQIAKRTNYRVGGPPKDFSVSNLRVQSLLDVPNFGASEESESGNIAYDNGKIVYFDGNTWVTLTAGVSSISNAPDTDPNPNPNFILNPDSHLRNLKTLGNGIVIQTLGNTIAFNYEPSFTNNPPANFYRPWVDGKFSSLYSTSLTINQDSDQNYSIEATGASLMPNAPNDLGIPAAEILNGSALRLLTAGEGVLITESDPNTNYIKISGYDVIQNFSTTDNTPFLISVPLATGESNYYTIQIKGVNPASQKLYYFEFKRGVKNPAGTIIFQTPVLNLVDTDGDAVSVNFSGGVEQFFVEVTGLPTQNIFWKFFLRRI